MPNQEQEGHNNVQVGRDFNNWVKISVEGIISAVVVVLLSYIFLKDSINTIYVNQAEINGKITNIQTEIKYINKHSLKLETDMKILDDYVKKDFLKEVERLENELLGIVKQIHYERRK